MFKSVKITLPMDNQGSSGSPHVEALRSGIKHVSVNDVRRFFRAIPKENLRDRLLFDLIYHYALRRSEVVLLELGDSISSTRANEGPRRAGD